MTGNGLSSQPLSIFSVLSTGDTAHGTILSIVTTQEVTTTMTDQDGTTATAVLTATITSEMDGTPTDVHHGTAASVDTTANS